MKMPPKDAVVLKPLRFLSAAHDDLLELPETVRHDFGYGLFLVQRGEMPENASPFEGSAGGNIMKLVERHDSDTYRCVFAAKFEKAIFILHVFKKKSTHGISTPQREIETVKGRFKRAQELYEEEFEAVDRDPPSGNTLGKKRQP